jgi:hypothetical protein
MITEALKTCQEKYPTRVNKVTTLLNDDSSRHKFVTNKQYEDLKIELEKIDLSNIINSCYDVSKQIAAELNKNDFKCEKIFAISRKNRVADIWGNHQATLIRKEAVRGYKGNRIKYLQSIVIDPMLQKIEGKEDMYFFLDEWVTLVTKAEITNQSNEISHVSYIIFPSIYFKPLGINYLDFFNPCDYLFEDEAQEDDKINKNPLIRFISF